MKISPEFNKKPSVTVVGRDNECFDSWQEIVNELTVRLNEPGDKKKIVIIETYQGVFLDRLISKFEETLNPDLLINMDELFYEESTIREMTQDDVTDDRVFGYMTRLQMTDFLDPHKTDQQRKNISESAGLTVVIGYGASLMCDNPSLFIYADLARWEIQQRMRMNLVSNLGIENREEHTELKYKRGFFVDWRVCDRLKKQTSRSWDYILDTNNHDQTKMVTSDAFFEGLSQVSHQPFSLVPFFDPGPWGGQWMKDKFSLDNDNENYAWCFNCVPEENSLLLKYGKTSVEIPAINLVFFQPLALLGDPVHARFGDEFPIRFDFLDTMAGGNLSLQVHPLTEYIQEKFGMHYTQDESYYLMDAEADGSVYLGLKEGIDREKMISEMKIAEETGNTFHPEKYVESFPAKKHDHFLIPAGTIHCSGRNGMVLEISATPYIFTFKLYDWGRVNLDGKPRPINLDHGIANIQWNRTTEWIKSNLLNRIEHVNEGDGWTEEKTGLHEREFIETRRHWFTKEVPHNTNNGVNVLTLVEGDAIIIESPVNAFKSFRVNYAETFIIPASVGEYTIRPSVMPATMKHATIKAFIRTNA